LQIELEISFNKWRNYQSNRSLSAGSRRRFMAHWLHLTWGLMRERRGFIGKTFDATCLVRKDGANRLQLKRLGRPYSPSFSAPPIDP
jgi:hypothetical protein